MLALVTVFVLKHVVLRREAPEAPGLSRGPAAAAPTVLPEREPTVLDLAPATLPRPERAEFAHPAGTRAEEVERLRDTYLRTYAPLARAEMEAYGIPASVTLAQGLLESVAGTSRLAVATNNHFGIKCFSRSCAPGHCRNFDDDHHKDFFRAYAHPRESYRAHSEFLRGGQRYAGLFALAPNDYRGWAQGLRRAGYATDPAYGDKLIALIERYDLTGYDRP